MLSAAGISGAEGYISELAAAGKSELAYVAEIKHEIKVGASDLEQFRKAVMRANDREIALTRTMGYATSYEVNIQDKAELEAIRRDIRTEARSAIEQLSVAAAQIKTFVRQGQREMRRSPGDAENRLAEQLSSLATVHANADGVVANITLLRDQAQGQLEQIQSRAGEDGVLGVYSGSCIMWPLGVGEYYDGNTTSGTATMFLRLSGDSIYGDHVPKANDKWSVARYSQYSTYGGQTPGKLVQATFDCSLDATGSIILGTFMTDLRTHKGHAGGPVYYELINGSLSFDRQTFNAELWNAEYNQFVGYLTLQRA